MIYFFIFAVSFIMAYLITPNIRYAALRTSAIDKRNDRKIHNRIIALLGGLAIYIGVMGGIAIIAVLVPSFFLKHIPILGGFVICSTLVLLLGIYDDFNGSGAQLKLLVQVVIALLLIRVGFRLERISIPGILDLNLGIFGVPMTILWLVGIINAVNLIDGLDGLATGLVGIAAAFLCVYGILLDEPFISWISLAIAGGCLGFLKYNFYPAKIFLGDTGSLFLGCAIGALAIYRSGPDNASNVFFFPVSIVLLLPIIDTALAVIRRTIRGHHIFQGDSSHIHHYFLRQGVSQIRIVFSFYFLTFCLGAASLLFLNKLY